MKILIVGGSGLIGGHAALHLQAEGHDVTLMSRNKPQSGPLSELPHIAGSYIDEPADSTRLEGFDVMVFAAAADIVQWCEHLLTPDTQIMAMKAQVSDTELSQLPKPFKVVGLHPLSVPGLDETRQLLIIRRVDGGAQAQEDKTID